MKLVSENQYKRVSIALSKDKEEIQLRQEMQKKFHNKLKSFGGSESRNLKKAKFSYIEMMNRRKVCMLIIFRKYMKNWHKSSNKRPQLNSIPTKRNNSKKKTSKLSLLFLFLVVSAQSLKKFLKFGKFSSINKFLIRNIASL